MKKYKLDNSLLSNVWVTWATTKNKQFDKRYWLNCKTGKKKDTPEDWMYYTNEDTLLYNHYYNNDNKISLGINYYSKNKPNIWVKANSNLMFAYAKYHADIDRLEVAAVKMDTSRKPEAHKWQYAGDRFFIGKDKSIIDENGNSYNGRYFRVCKGKRDQSGKYMLRTLLRFYECKGFANEFKKFIGNDFFTNYTGNTINIEYAWHLQLWYESVQRTRKENKTQNTIDNLIQLPLTDASGFAEKYPPIKRNGWDDILDVVYFERINDEWCVLRSFFRKQDNTLQENWRFYIGDNGKNCITSYSDNSWLPANNVRHNWRNHYGYLVNQDEAVAKCNRIKYIMNTLGDQQKAYLVNKITTMLRHPEIEQFAKLGISDFALGLSDSPTPKADIKDMFGGYYNEKEKSILRKIGMTKYQFDAYRNIYNYDGYSSRKTLGALRRIFGNDLSSLDNQSFDEYLSTGNKISSYRWSMLERAESNLDLDMKKIFKNMVRLSHKSSSVLDVICDTLGDYSRLYRETAPVINWCFHTEADAVRAHNDIMALLRIQEEERRALYNMEEAKRREKEEERRKKIDEDRKQYEYEDEEFIIRLPKDLGELVTEGSVQHICIGSYTTSHAMGQTNLFFLRKKSNPDVPFYAIEMSNSKNIIQIHGFGNKWLGNNPEVIPTVIRWLRKHGIKCSNEILTCTATGYGKTANYVPMPVVD